MQLISIKDNEILKNLYDCDVICVVLMNSIYQTIIKIVRESLE
jgi:hypothetical protein